MESLLTHTYIAKIGKIVDPHYELHTILIAFIMMLWKRLIPKLKSKILNNGFLTVFLREKIQDIVLLWHISKGISLDKELSTMFRDVIKDSELLPVIINW